MFLRRAAIALFAVPLLILPLRQPVDAAAPPETRLLRTPTVSATKVAFTYAQNIWVVDRAGGVARRLTSLPGGTSNPHFSPDGSMIAFSADYSGNTDVYVVPADGGEPKRLTWHPGGDSVQGWTADGRKVMFASGRDTWAPGNAPRFWTVPVEGGVEEPLPIPRGYQGSISPDGRRIAYRLNTSWDEERRNYRGGQNKAIWIVDLDDYDLETPPWENRTKETDPVWLGQTVYWISDRDGVANVWAYDTSNKRLRQMTKFRDFDVKSVDAGAGVVVFEQAGYIHELNPENGQTKKLTISVASDFPWMMPRWEDVSNRMTNLAVSPTGKRALVEARGEIFTIPVENGDVRNLTQSSGSAEKQPAWSPDGKHISYFSDASGEYSLMIVPQDGLGQPREVKLPAPTQYYTASWSPDSTKLLYTDTDVKVWVLDVETGQTKVVGQEMWMVPQRTLNPAWSPDSKWVAYSARLRSLYHAIFATNIETGETIQMTDGLADAQWPAWDASGKYLWFLASTDFGLSSQWLDMTRYPFTTTFGLYFAILKKGEPTPLLPESDEETGVPAGRGNPAGPGGGGGRGGRGGQAAEGGDQPAPRPQGPVTVTIDADGNDLVFRTERAEASVGV